MGKRYDSLRVTHIVVLSKANDTLRVLQTTYQGKERKMSEDNMTIQTYLTTEGFVVGELFRVEGYRQATRGLRESGGYLWWEVSPDWRIIDPATGEIDTTIESALLNGASPVRYYRRMEQGFEPLTNEL